jgi:hypothetical protein
MGAFKTLIVVCVALVELLEGMKEEGQASYAIDPVFEPWPLPVALRVTRISRARRASSGLLPESLKMRTPFVPEHLGRERRDNSVELFFVLVGLTGM